MKVIFVNMVADLFHYGHVRFLKRAKAEGDKLIVGLHDDDLCIDYKRKPIMSLQERKEVIEACKYVDEVIGGTPLYITRDFIDKYKIDLILHAHPIEESDKYNSFNELPIQMGIYKRLDYTETISTTQIMERIKSL